MYTSVGLLVSVEVSDWKWAVGREERKTRETLTKVRTGKHVAASSHPTANVEIARGVDQRVVGSVRWAVSRKRRTQTVPFEFRLERVFPVKS